MRGTCSTAMKEARSLSRHVWWSSLQPCRRSGTLYKVLDNLSQHHMHCGASSVPGQTRKGHWAWDQSPLHSSCHPAHQNKQQGKACIGCCQYRMDMPGRVSPDRGPRVELKVVGKEHIDQNGDASPYSIPL